MQIAWGYAPTLIVAAAVRHGLFDRLATGPLSVPALAHATGASERGVRILLNALVGLGLLDRTGDSFALTPESDLYLVSGRSEFRGSFFHHHADQLLPQWMHLAEVVQTGQPVRSTNAERSGCEHFAGFVESLFPGGYPAARALGEHLSIPRLQRPFKVLDLGAGSGVWGIALAEQSSFVRVCAVDWPAVLEVTRRVAARRGVGDRLEEVAGDLFVADFGTGYDLATLGHILHSESAGRNRQLLRKAYQALAPGGVVAIQEFVADDDRRGPVQALIFAVNKLVNTDAGDTYTGSEMCEWLREAGFQEPRRLEVPGPSPLILATKS